VAEEKLGVYLLPEVVGVTNIFPGFHEFDLDGIFHFLSLHALYFLLNCQTRKYRKIIQHSPGDGKPSFKPKEIQL
jgi:hypothetical protein